MESNEQEGRSRWLRVEPVLRHDQDRALDEKSEIRHGRAARERGERRGGGGEEKRCRRRGERDKCRCNLHRCGTDVRTYEPDEKVGLSYDSVCSRGPALDPAKRIFFLFFISSSAAPP